MWIRTLLLLTFCLTSITCYADTTRPKVVLNNGVTASVNYYNEHLIQTHRFGFAFDQNPHSIWYLPTRNKTALIDIHSDISPIKKIGMNVSCNKDQKVSFLVEGKAIPPIVNEGDERIAKFGDVRDLRITIAGPKICINDLRMELGRQTRNIAFVEETGGGYPDVYLYAKGRYVEHFNAGNIGGYFIRDGKFVVFELNADIGPLGGIKIVNLQTLNSVEYLKNELLDFDSIKWNGNEVSGVVYKPNENWKGAPFKIRVVFP